MIRYRKMLAATADPRIGVHTFTGAGISALVGNAALLYMDRGAGQFLSIIAGCMPCMCWVVSLLCSYFLAQGKKCKDPEL